MLLQQGPCLDGRDSGGVERNGAVGDISQILIEFLGPYIYRLLACLLLFSLRCRLLLDSRVRLCFSSVERTALLASSRSFCGSFLSFTGCASFLA